MSRKRVLVVGLGNMGMSHALAYTRIPEFEVVGVCTRAHRTTRSCRRRSPEAKRYSDYEKALAELKPDVVSINTLPDTHADYAIKAMEAGAHVFVEKPLAETVESAQGVVDTAKRTGRKLVIGYILRHHPSWIKFIEIARQLGTPLVFRMNLNQQSNGETWDWHKRLMDSFPPIVDCGVHYVDVMCQMTPGEAGARAGDGRAADRRGAGLQLRHAAGRLRRRLGRLVRGRLGADDERDGVLREGRDRAEGLRLDRHGGDRRRA